MYDAPYYEGSGKLEGKVAIITGGDSGIGRAVAVLFAREGADVVIVYLAEDDDADATRRGHRGRGPPRIGSRADVRRPQACRDAVARTVKEFGGFNVLVNNAAFQLHAPSFEDLTPSISTKRCKTNLYGYFHMRQAAVDATWRPATPIVNTGSVTGIRRLARTSSTIR